MRVKLFAVQDNYAVVKIRRAFVEYDRSTEHYILSLVINEDDWYEVYIESKREAHAVLDELTDNGYASVTKWYAIHKEDQKKYTSGGEDYVSVKSLGTLKLSELIKEQVNHIKSLKD